MPPASLVPNSGSRRELTAADASDLTGTSGATVQDAITLDSSESETEKEQKDSEAFVNSVFGRTPEGKSVSGCTRADVRGALANEIARASTSPIKTLRTPRRNPRRDSEIFGNSRE